MIRYGRDLGRPPGQVRAHRIQRDPVEPRPVHELHLAYEDGQPEQQDQRADPDDRAGVGRASAATGDQAARDGGRRRRHDQEEVEPGGGLFFLGLPCLAQVLVLGERHGQRDIRIVSHRPSSRAATRVSVTAPITRQPPGTWP
jgi:hypothetical protein